uniref:Uncharacterized protein n=1 Tax=Arundo donax TaxID=35708 RepID=A0A0A8YM93_ARUDO
MFMNSYFNFVALVMKFGGIPLC